MLYNKNYNTNIQMSVSIFFLYNREKYIIFIDIFTAISMFLKVIDKYRYFLDIAQL